MRRSGLWKLAAAAVCVLGALFVVAALSPGNTAGPCVVAQGPVLLRDVPEASGLAVSRRRPGLLWTHNDSGNAPDLFALDASGTMQGTVRLPIRSRDWEDLSAGPCPSGDCLYIADIGDNDMARRNIQIYRVPEPDPSARQTARPDVFTVTYPDGAHNAEALFVVGGRVFVITRDRTGVVYRSTASLDDVVSGFSRVRPNIPLERIGQLGLAAVTDAEASPDETSVAVRTSHEVVVYQTADLIRGGDVPSAERIPIDGLREPQGEGVALGANGAIYLASEGRPWNRAGRFISLRCATRPL